MSERVWTVTVYGASDDLIEIGGDISEEFNPDSYDDAQKGSYLAFSDGSVWKITYGDGGMWRITPVMRGTAEAKKTEATSEENDYSDRLTLTGDVRWVVHGSNFAKAKK